MPGLRKQVFLGTFISSKSRQELEYLHDAAVCVDSDGKIVKIDKDCANAELIDDRLLGKLGWERSDVDVHVAKPGQFFFPGFIGEFGHSGSASSSVTRLELDRR